MSVAALAPKVAVATPERRTCLNCRRQRYHSAADALRCDEPRSNAMGGVIYLGFRKAKQSTHTEQAMQVHCRLAAERCKFFQEEA